MRLSLAFVLAAGFASAQDEEPTLPELEKRITIQQQGGFAGFVAFFREGLGVNIFVDPRCAKEADLETHRVLVLKSVKGSSALRWMTWLYGLDFAVQDKIVVIGKREWVDAPVLRHYDIQSLLVKIQDFPGEKMTLAEKGVGFLGTAEEPKQSSVGGADDVISLIKENIAPGTWEDRCAIEATPDQRLLVTHGRSVQREVAKFLDTLGSLLGAQVTLSAEIVEADDGSLLHPAYATVIGPGEIEKTVDALKKARRDGRACALQVNALSTQRVFATIRDQGTAVVSWDKNDPVIGSGALEMGVLDCRPVLVSDGKYVLVEMRLSLGQGAEADPKLKTRERTETLLATTFLIPNGGGVLFALPARRSSGGRPQLCLLRAASVPPPPIPSRVKIDIGDVSTSADLLERVEKLPAASCDFQDAALKDFLQWFRDISGMNVVCSPDLEDSRVTIRCKDLALSKILLLVLDPTGLGIAVRDEAILVLSKDKGRQTSMQIAMFDVQDMTYGLQDFPGCELVETDDGGTAGMVGEEGPKQQFTGDDLASLMKNTIHKDRWEEADGASIRFMNGYLWIRNTPDVVQACAKFLTDLRQARLRIVTMRADTLLVPAQAADAILGRAGTDTYLIDAKQYESLLACGTIKERMGWHSYESQRTSLFWHRRLGYLRDLDDKGPILGDFDTGGTLDVRPFVSRDRKSILMELRYTDRQLQAVGTLQIGKGETIQTPSAHSVRTRTTMQVPDGKFAIFKWSAPAKDGGERQYRLLILKPGLWHE